jgi:hypothetical protein
MWLDRKLTFKMHTEMKCAAAIRAFLLGRLPIGITSGTGSHEPRTWGTAPSHAQPLRHCPGALPALRAQ